MTLSNYRYFLMLLRVEQRQTEGHKFGEHFHGKSKRLTLIEAEIEILPSLDHPTDYVLRKESFLKRLQKASEWLPPVEMDEQREA